MAKKVKPGDLRTYPEWVHQELVNWSRWCWQGEYPQPIPPSTCFSFEKNYRRRGEEEEAREKKPIPPNEINAAKVQAVWDVLPHLQQQVLRAEYPQRFQSGRVYKGRAGSAQWLGISLNEYEAALSNAVYRVMVIFEGGI